MVRRLMQEGLQALDFLRVAFGDEDGGRFLRGDTSSKVLCERMEQIPRDGININGRRYEFLGYSSSQLKELGMWFVHFDRARQWNVKKVWQWIGDLDQIRLPSKFAARMGQAFSTTVTTVQLNPSSNLQARRGVAAASGQQAFSMAVENDVERHGKVFTDGSGTISRENLDACLRKVPFLVGNIEDVGIVQVSAPDPTPRSDLKTVSERGNPPQVRIGGAKGTLALDPSLPRRGQDGKDVHCVLRQSMLKYDADMRDMEVVSVGKQLPYFLNQSVIAMLETHGVRQHVFMQVS
eukprot:3200310-Rhodomonas_salina.1